jgi:hypothetical protein
VTIRKLVSVVPVIVVLALAAPVASADAQTTAVSPSAIPCYPYPAFCGPNGKSWLSFWFPFSLENFAVPTVPFGPVPVQLLPG